VTDCQGKLHGNRCYLLASAGSHYCPGHQADPNVFDHPALRAHIAAVGEQAWLDWCRQGETPQTGAQAGLGAIPERPKRQPRRPSV